jgi:hypothetical protein
LMDTLGFASGYYIRASELPVSRCERRSTSDETNCAAVM